MRGTGFFVVLCLCMELDDWTNDLCAHVAQLVERVLGKDEVISSTLIMGSSSQI